MRKLKKILVAAVVVASLYAAAGTAWARSDTLQRGTSWTEADGMTVPSEPGGVSWELFGASFEF
jgi:hypothetical protein